MKNKKILIIGASGQIGGACLKELAFDFEVHGTFFSHPKKGLMNLDFTDEAKISNIMEKVRPDIVILTAALTNVDYCQTHEKEAELMNAHAVALVCNQCTKMGSRLVYISTDYVFDGKSGPYGENAKTSPINIYGKTKLKGEIEAMKSKEWLIIRTGNVFDFGFDEKNFVVRLIERLRRGEEVLAQTDLYASPTLATHIAKGIKMLLLKGKSGIYNICGKETISRYELSLTVARFFNLDSTKIVPVKTTDMGSAALRPLKGGLRSDKAELDVGLKPLPLLEALEIIKGKMYGAK